MLDAFPALVFLLDAEGRIRRANGRAAEQLGQRPEQLEGSELSCWLPASAAAQREVQQAAVQAGQPRLGVVEQLELPGRGKRWFSSALLPQTQPSAALVVVYRDVTDERQLESQLLQAQKLDSIGKLAGGVAHDFNNLLTTFFGLITAAQRALPTESMAHEYLSLMQLAVEGGANFTRQLLAFARRQVSEPRVADLNRLVRETCSLLSRVLDAHISLDVQLGGEPLPVRIDPSHVSQLLMNLALNARDAIAGAGTLTFRTASVSVEDSSRWALAPALSGRYVLLSVEDTGEGLSDEAKAHLFEPFFTSKALGYGTGLGLATCYGIVKQNGGHIRVESERGRGTIFRIYLPRVEAELDPPRPQRPQAPVRAGNETLLFAEDDDLVRHLSVATLASAGYRMIEALDGVEALSATREHMGRIHLLVTDVSMPRLGGVELARRFVELRPDAGVLFISGYAGGAELGPGANVLNKPFTNDELLARVREALDALQVAANAERQA